MNESMHALRYLSFASLRYICNCVSEAFIPLRPVHVGHVVLYIGTARLLATPKCRRMPGSVIFAPPYLGAGEARKEEGRKGGGRKERRRKTKRRKAGGACRFASIPLSYGRGQRTRAVMLLVRCAKSRAHMNYFACFICLVTYRGIRCSRNARRAHIRSFASVPLSYRAAMSLG